MRKYHSIDQRAVVTARQAQSDAARMQRDIGSLRDGVAGLAQSIRTPVIRPPRTRTKRTTNTPIWGTVTDFAAQDLLGVAGIGGGYASLAQSAGNQLAALALGQRIR